MNRTNRLLSSLLVLALLLLALVGLGPSNRLTFAGDVGVAPTDGTIAVTGLSREDTETLYLIDTRNQTLLVYETDRGKGIRLVAARSYRYDLDLLEYNDLSERGFKASELKKRAEGREEQPGD